MLQPRLCALLIQVARHLEALGSCPAPFGDEPTYMQRRAVTFVMVAKTIITLIVL